MKSQVYVILHDNERVLLAKKKEYPAWFDDQFYGRIKPKNLYRFEIGGKKFSFYVGGINLKFIDPNAYVIPGGKAETTNYISEGYREFYSETGINLNNIETLNIHQTEFRDGLTKFYGIYVHVSEKIFNICYELSCYKLKEAEQFRTNIKDRIREYEEGNFTNLPPINSNEIRKIYSVQINTIKENSKFFTKRNNWYSTIINNL